MPLELPPLTGLQRLNHLQSHYTHKAAIPVLQQALIDPVVGSVAMVSSFGAESVVLLHMLASIDATIPVLFLDTEMHFPETLEYQSRLARELGLTNVRRITPDPSVIAYKDPDGTLHKTDPNTCCGLRKTAPLQNALAGYDTWITGRKRFQSTSRTTLQSFELDGSDRIKINPLAHWRHSDVIAYIEDNALPKHPKIKEGFLSIGCAPCTSKTVSKEDLRSGRWQGSNKVECGIHIDENGVIQPNKGEK